MKWLAGSGMRRGDVRVAGQGGTFRMSGDRSQHLVTMPKYRHNCICTAVCIELETQRQLYGNRMCPTICCAQDMLPTAILET